MNRINRKTMFEAIVSSQYTSNEFVLKLTNELQCESYPQVTRLLKTGVKTRHTSFLYCLVSRAAERKCIDEQLEQCMAKMIKLHVCTRRKNLKGFNLLLKQLVKKRNPLLKAATTRLNKMK
jgi:hypothetical protein